MKWDKVFKSGLSKFFKGCFPQNLLSPHLNTLYQMSFANEKGQYSENINPKYKDSLQTFSSFLYLCNIWEEKTPKNSILSHLLHISSK